MSVSKAVGCRVGALNVNGLGAESKQEIVLNRLFNDGCDVIVLTDTRLDETDFENLDFYTTLPTISPPQLSKSTTAAQLSLGGLQ